MILTAFRRVVPYYAEGAFLATKDLPNNWHPPEVLRKKIQENMHRLQKNAGITFLWRPPSYRFPQK